MAFEIGGRAVLGQFRPLQRGIMMLNAATTKLGHPVASNEGPSGRKVRTGAASHMSCTASESWMQLVGK